MTDERMRELFREMRDEPVPADSRARVRIAVAERTRRRRWIWPVLAASAAAAMLGVIAIPRRAPETPPRVVAVQRPQPTAIPQPPPDPRPAPRAAPVRRVRPPAPRTEDVTIRIETADPDVVILLVGSGG